MDSLHIPEIYCPFLLRTSPHLEAVEAHTLEWAQRFGLLQHDHALEYYRMANFPGLACRVYPEAGQEELFLASDWLFYIFVLDDPFDEGWFDNRPEEMLAFHEHLLAVVRNPPLATPRGPLAEALSDIFRRARCFASSDWLKRFALHHAQYFAAMRWQVANRARKHMPDVQAYLNNRAHAAGVFPVFDWIELVQHGEVPPTVYESQPLQAILRAGVNIIGWTNDVYSAKKDRDCSDVNSLLKAIQREQSSTLQDAVQHVCAMIETETRHLQEMMTNNPVYPANVRRLVTGVAYWIRGHLDWYRGNERYSDGKFHEVSKEASYIEKIFPPTSCPRARALQGVPPVDGHDAYGRPRAATAAGAWAPTIAY
jgi:5-epi-alpha-selinene synthase